MLWREPTVLKKTLGIERRLWPRFMLVLFPYSVVKSWKAAKLLSFESNRFFFDILQNINEWKNGLIEVQLTSVCCHYFTRFLYEFHKKNYMLLKNLYVSFAALTIQLLLKNYFKLRISKYHAYRILYIKYFYWCWIYKTWHCLKKSFFFSLF